MPGFHHSAAVLPLPFRRSRCRSRCRCRCRCVSFCCLRLQRNGIFLRNFYTEQRNFTTAERRNDNGRTTTEWWKPGITAADMKFAYCGDVHCQHGNQPNQIYQFLPKSVLVVQFLLSVNFYYNFLKNVLFFRIAKA